MHDRDIVHGDLGNHDNILVSADKVHLFDHDRSIILTKNPKYREPAMGIFPPERELSTKTDIWAIGRILMDKFQHTIQSQCFLENHSQDCHFVNLLRQMIDNDARFRPTIDQCISRFNGIVNPSQASRRVFPRYMCRSVSVKIR